MSIQELVDEALKLPEEERALLAERLLASLGSRTVTGGDDPIFGLGRTPVSCGVRDASVEHDSYLYEPGQR